MYDKKLVTYSSPVYFHSENPYTRNLLLSLESQYLPGSTLIVFLFHDQKGDISSIVLKLKHDLFEWRFDYHPFQVI